MIRLLQFRWQVTIMTQVVHRAYTSSDVARETIASVPIGTARVSQFARPRLTIFTTQLVNPPARCHWAVVGFRMCCQSCHVEHTQHNLNMKLRPRPPGGLIIQRDSISTHSLHSFRPGMNGTRVAIPPFTCAIITCLECSDGQKNTRAVKLRSKRHVLTNRYVQV